MCQILVKVKDNHRPGQTNPNLVSRPGDPIVCMPNDHVWGRKETWPNFFVIKFNDISVARMKEFCESESNILHIIVEDPKTGRPVQVPYRNVTYKRKWRFDMGALGTRAIRNNGLVCVGETRECDFTWAQFQNFIVHKPKNKTLPELRQ